MTRDLSSELRLAIAGLIACLLVGWVIGRPLLVPLLGTAVYLGWHLLNLQRLLRYLKDKEAPVPESSGAWSVVFRGVERIKKRERKRKKRLQKAVDDFRQAASAMPDAAVILKDDGEITWFNKAATELLGLQHPQDLEQHIVNLIRAPAFVDYMERGSFNEPLDFVSPVNENIHLLLRVVPYGSNRNLLLARDVTRLHRLEQMRKDFVANVSHELRSPLTVIVGYLETLRDDPNAVDSLQRPLEQMWEQSQRMCFIVEDLLRLSRIENQPGVAPRDAVAIAEMLARIREDAAKLSSGTHEIVLNADSRLRLLGEYNELFSAFSNLVFNAVQYTPKGGNIEISWQAEESGARLDVVDTGIGIEPHHLPRLTERFYRVDKARSRKVGGTGLGLAIVKHVLMRHDATMKVESVPGEGSRFSCRFPRARIQKIAEQRAVSSV
jgi:two-component system phosphate regulon sensor histidine kinase PhoR